MVHVELIQNEWAAGQQRVVAKLVLSGSSELQLETDDEETWGALALKPFRHPDTGREISPTADPELFVRSLHRHLNGDYIFATEAHEEGECEYPIGQELPLSAVVPGEPDTPDAQ
jgi:hypothetical protein